MAAAAGDGGGGADAGGNTGGGAAAAAPPGPASPSLRELREQADAAAAPSAADGGDGEGAGGGAGLPPPAEPGGGAWPIDSAEARRLAEAADVEAGRRHSAHWEKAAGGDPVEAPLAPEDPDPSSPADDGDRWQPGGELRVFVGTWNMEGAAADSIGGEQAGDLGDFVPRARRMHIICVGTQECQRTIARSVFNSSKADWEAALQAHLGAQYVLLGSSTLMAMHVCVLARRDISAYINSATIASAHVGTGIAGTVGNKGGVGVSFSIGSGDNAVSLLFLSGHFAAHQHKVNARNHDYARVTQDIHLGTLCPSKEGAPPRHADSNGTNVRRVAGESTAPIRDVTDEFDLVWFCGDFNYRVDGTRSAVDEVLRRAAATPQYQRVLLANDQLRSQMRRGEVFNGFREGPVDFPPTYKYAKDPVTGLASDGYETKKMRIPSWCDRILFKQHPQMLEHTSHAPGIDLGLHVCTYGHVDSIRVSDHRPVCATFRVRTPLPPQGADASPPLEGFKPKEQSRTCAVQ